MVMELCPTCQRTTPCPTCSPDGDFLHGAPRAERFHWFRRIIWALHKLRQTYSRKSTVLTEDISDIIRRTEANEEASLDVDEEPTDVH